MASDPESYPPGNRYPSPMDLPPFTQPKLARHYASLASELPLEYRKNHVGVINSATAGYHALLRRIRSVTRWIDQVKASGDDDVAVNIAEISRDLMLEQARERYARGDWINPRYRRLFALCFGPHGE